MQNPSNYIYVHTLCRVLGSHLVYEKSFLYNAVSAGELMLITVSQWQSISNAKSTITPSAATPWVCFSAAHQCQYEILIIFSINILKDFLNTVDSEHLLLFSPSSPATLFDLKGDGGEINTIIDLENGRGGGVGCHWFSK